MGKSENLLYLLNNSKGNTAKLRFEIFPLRANTLVNNLFINTAFCFVFAGP